MIIGSDALPGLSRFAQIPTELSVAPAPMVWFQLNPGPTVITPVVPLKLPFQLSERRVAPFKLTVTSQPEIDSEPMLVTRKLPQ